MCNCRNTYPLSVQLRMAAVDLSIRAGNLMDKGSEYPEKEDGTDYTDPEKVTMELLDRSERIEEFMLGGYACSQLDEPPKQVPTMGAAYRSIVAQDLAKLGVLHADAAQQEKLADWISTGTA